MSGCSVRRVLHAVALRDALWECVQQGLRLCFCCALPAVLLCAWVTHVVCCLLSGFGYLLSTLLKCAADCCAAVLLCCCVAGCRARLACM